jgi:chondroitin-sulfate-ABC endolyase/exolyase
MERAKAEGSVVMSVCTPDLGITEKGYTTTQPSQPLVKTVKLNGAWTLKTQMPNVTVAADGENTVVTATCIHGQPVEFELVK